ncbi:alpha-(1,3)-fucosyltransferase C isoform X2 [Aplysia californica]|uniref:Fucosyltransferase n=1 Tax=Aplysia californica TaxID=6500 RepID=A0ABM0JS57_APLCA|nr:alpha-(1,3)-fucosyltransferase C isoform X2 [Aplysia californica]
MKHTVAGKDSYTYVAVAGTPTSSLCMMRSRLSRMPKLLVLVTCLGLWVLLSLVAFGGLLGRHLSFWQQSDQLEDKKRLLGVPGSPYSYAKAEIFMDFPSVGKKAGEEKLPNLGPLREILDDEEDISQRNSKEEEMESQDSVRVRAARRNSVPKMIDFNPRFGAEKRFTFSKCERKCAMTSHVDEADVVMFNAVWVRNTTLPTRRPGQLWVLYTREPPTHKGLVGLKRPSLTNQFNWTYTVLSDSTFQVLYGKLQERSPPAKNYESIYNAKEHEAAWFVGHCPTHSRREDYVKRMGSKVSVHIFGECGNMTCGSRGYDMGGSKEKCLGMLSNKYKFYLAFENSLCRDYVTEKFFNLYNNVNVIPVVRGGADYDSLFPVGTFINAAHFDSPELLGKYLRELGRDKEKYLAILKRKDRYRALSGGDFQCDLCEAAYTHTPKSIYKNIGQWMSPLKNCQRPTDL